MDQKVPVGQGGWSEVDAVGGKPVTGWRFIFRQENQLGGPSQSNMINVLFL